jgi:hypothetical protein
MDNTVERVNWKRAMLYEYKCEKGAQIYRLGVQGFVSKIRISNIPHAGIYIDDVILQDILGDTVVDITKYMQCIYKELRTCMAFPLMKSDASMSILKRSGNSRLDQSDKKLISINEITVDLLMSTSKYDRRFNSINTSKCTITIKVDKPEDITFHEYQTNNVDDIRPNVEYSIYEEPIMPQSQPQTYNGNHMYIIDVTQFESQHMGGDTLTGGCSISSKSRLSNVHSTKICCSIL